MKALLKKITAALLSAALMLAAVPFTAYAAAESVTNGSCTFTLDDDGTLTISGSGTVSSSVKNAVSDSGATDVIIEDGITDIGDNAFNGCSSIKSVTIADSVTSIGNSAFSDCTKLESIDLGKGVETISDFAFFNCNKLKSIYIPEKVSYIGSETFTQCRSLDYITVDEANTFFDSRDNCNAIIDTHNNYLCYGSNNTVIPESIKGIGENAFSERASLKSVTIPSGVSVGFWAFTGCRGLTSLTISEGVPYLGEYAFNGCSGLKHVSLPDSIRYLEKGVFYGCSGLESLPDFKNVTSIGEEAFGCCSNIKSIKLPPSVVYIDEWAFWGCGALTSVVIPEKVSISELDPEVNTVFQQCDNLTIFGYEYSDAYYYALNHGINFVSLRFDYPLSKGDMNGDFEINGKDAALLARRVSGWDGYAEIELSDSADINGDGRINGQDSAILMRYTSGWDGYARFFN